MIEARDAFKLGFLQRLAEEGLTGPEIGRRVSTAASLLKNASLSELITKPMGMGLNAGMVTALAAPVALGVGGGYLLHKANEKPIDEEDVKDTEMIDEYRRLARVAKLNARLKLLRRRIGQ